MANYFLCPNCNLNGGHKTKSYVKIKKKFQGGYTRTILKESGNYFICRFCHYIWTYDWWERIDWSMIYSFKIYPTLFPFDTVKSFTLTVSDHNMKECTFTSNEIIELLSAFVHHQGGR